MTKNLQLPESESVQFESYFDILYQRWAHLSEFLPAHEADPLFKLAQELPFEKVPRRYKQALQIYDRFALRLDTTDHPAREWLMPLGQLAEDFVREGKFVDPDFARFESREVAVQRYGKGGLLTGHRDLESDPIAIGIFSFGDDAYLDILEDDRQTIITTALLKHGDFVILGAPGLGNHVRPMHRLRVPEDADDTYGRISITYRGLRTPLRDLGYKNV